jgi:hypothetical protein
MSSKPTESTRTRGQQKQPYMTTPLPTTMQWVLLALVTFLTMVILTMPVVFFFLTKNLMNSMIPVSTTIPLSYMWYRIIHFNFPKKKEDYDLEALKIKNGATTHDKIKRLPSQLRASLRETKSKALPNQSLCEHDTQHEG